MVFDDVVKDILVIYIGHLAVFIRDLAEQNPCDSREIARSAYCFDIKIERKRLCENKVKNRVDEILSKRKARVFKAGALSFLQVMDRIRKAVFCINSTHRCKRKRGGGEEFHKKGYFFTCIFG